MMEKKRQFWRRSTVTSTAGDGCVITWAHGRVDCIRLHTFGMPGFRHSKLGTEDSAHLGMLHTVYPPYLAVKDNVLQQRSAS
ncbi:hypothetical protein T265_04707 [Opisthorchis viverrini]|uniref:Uncharacterized protein n=1 Tax=Opisthorchis viverrini TaxID=6198 RepID=A0A074ZM68_OPIVI|nr:hypothetical protein T265_04707 [Opisthorchis viverrini]KER28483.1 hypothetical protein T265_04707 [Opisthorchis viverrini]